MFWGVVDVVVKAADVWDRLLKPQLFYLLLTTFLHTVLSIDIPLLAVCEIKT